MTSSNNKQQPIAIIGMACIFPGASSMRHFWENIVGGVDAISDVPAERWDPVYYQPESDAVDRFYCKRGGFIDQYADFDPLAYGIMPKAAEGADPDQLLALRVGHEALEDAGLLDKPFNRDKTGVIIGRGNYLSAGTLRLNQHVRMVQQTMTLLDDLLPDLSQADKSGVEQQLRDQLDHYGPDTAIGLIPNLVASRLANRLDLHGPAYTVDGACASALLAVEQAAQELRSGNSDVMIAGGVHLTHDLTFWATFCQLGALSRNQTIRPFDKNSDGILVGEGIGMFVLKRLDDAVADNDRIYATLDGIASASDGRAASLMAPAVEGQTMALERAWSQTPISPEHIGLVEAHGTGTGSGDQAEVETLKHFFGQAEDDQSRAVMGSVKSMIGHTMPAAGAAGLIKAALSIYHGVLPPTLHCENPLEEIQQTRFKTIGQSQEWKAELSKRVAAVNAFGFGGINAHAVLKGHENKSTGVELAESIAAAMPEALFFAGDSVQALVSQLANPQTINHSPNGLTGSYRLVIIQPNEKRLKLAKTIVEKDKPWAGRNQIYFSNQSLLANGAKVAFVYPGIDSQFEPRIDDLKNYFDWQLSTNAQPNDPAEALSEVARGVIEVNARLSDALASIGIQPDALAGHSIGEWSAMIAAGTINEKDNQQLSDKIQTDDSDFPDVLFLAAGCGIDTAQTAIEGIEQIALSHDNCPHQVILCGHIDAIALAESRLREQQVLVQRLPFVSGFHSPLFKEFVSLFADSFSSITLKKPQLPLWSATDCKPYPDDNEGMQTLVVRHLLEPVRFQPLIKAMYDDGVRAFIQVGTGSLIGFIDDILKQEQHISIAANVPKRSGLEQLCHVAAALWADGAALNTQLLWPEQQTISSEKVTKADNSLRLKLGVPLVHLDKALPSKAVIQVANSAEALSISDNQMMPMNKQMVVNDPLQALFQDTLDDIHTAAEQVLSVWQQRQTAHVSKPPAESIPDNVLPISSRLIKTMDLNKTVPYVIDHTFYRQRVNWPIIEDLCPVIPMTMEVALMREAVEEVRPEHKVIALEDIRAFNWFVIAEPVDAVIDIKWLSSNKAKVTIENYAEAIAIVAPDYEPYPSANTEALVNPRDTEIDAVALYEMPLMFHGPAYQGVNSLGPIGDNGIVGTIKVPAGKGSLLDNMGQLAGYWVMDQEEKNNLPMPIGLKRVRFFENAPAVGRELQCQTWLRHLDSTTAVTDIELTDVQGRVLVEIEGWETRRYDMDKAFVRNMMRIDSKLMSTADDAGFVIFEDVVSSAVARDDLKKRFLTQDEIQSHDSLPPRRKRDWLAGRIAAKDAVRHYLFEDGSKPSIFPKELQIKNNEKGQPQVFNHINTVLADDLSLSIAHKNRIAVSIASDKPVGIDIEAVEPRDKSFEKMVFTDQEMRLLPEDNRDYFIALFWAAKEAVGKMHGVGLQGRPKDLVVTEINEDTLKVNGITVKSTEYKNHVICWTESEK